MPQLHHSTRLHLSFHRRSLIDDVKVSPKSDAADFRRFFITLPFSTFQLSVCSLYISASTRWYFCHWPNNHSRMLTGGHVPKPRSSHFLCFLVALLCPLKLKFHLLVLISYLSTHLRVHSRSNPIVFLSQSLITRFFYFCFCFWGGEEREFRERERERNLLLIVAR